MVNEFDDIPYGSELWIVTRPEVRHDHQTQVRFKRVGEDLVDRNTVIGGVADGSEELRDVQLLSLLVEGLDGDRLMVRKSRRIYDLMILWEQ